jgi:hypothetical protein
VDVLFAGAVATVEARHEPSEADMLRPSVSHRVLITVAALLVASCNGHDVSTSHATTLEAIPVGAGVPTSDTAACIDLPGDATIDGCVELRSQSG